MGIEQMRREENVHWHKNPSMDQRLRTLAAIDAWGPNVALTYGLQRIRVRNIKRRIRLNQF